MSKKPQQPPPPTLHLRVGSSATTAATNGSSAASPGHSSSSSRSHHSSSPPRPAAAGGIGSWQACAACKYQRRKCTSACPLAPYFPADQPRRFHNAQRLFGVSNLTKTLRRVGPKYADDAMRSLVYEAEARAADPVAGCVGVIEELQRQIHGAQAELQLVRQQIAICRQQAASDPVAAMLLPAGAANPVPGQDDDMVGAAEDAIYAGQQQPFVPAGDPWSYQQQLCNYFNETAAGDEATSDQGMLQKSVFADDVIDDGSTVAKAGSPAVALGVQLGHHCQIQPLPFVKADVLPATIQHHGPADDDVDERMEVQQATAGAPCPLKLGFSSFSGA